jgi:hypothetical protein
MMVSTSASSLFFTFELYPQLVIFLLLHEHGDGIVIQSVMYPFLFILYIYTYIFFFKISFLNFFNDNEMSKRQKNKKHFFPILIFKCFFL